VVETVAPNRPDKAFGERILPRTSSGREDRLDPHALDALAEGITVYGISVAKEIGRGGVVGKGVHDLLSGPRRGGMLGEVEVQDAAPMVSEHDEDEEHPQLGGGNGEEVDRDQIPDMVREERAPGLRGRQRALRVRRETVRSATSMPSFRSSPWIRGTPHSGLAATILRTRATSSALIDGRPTLDLLESLAQ
jgi:hypothetical protein